MKTFVIKPGDTVIQESDSGWRPMPFPDGIISPALTDMFRAAARQPRLTRIASIDGLTLREALAKLQPPVTPAVKFISTGAMPPDKPLDPWAVGWQYYWFYQEMKRLSREHGCSFSAGKPVFIGESMIPRYRGRI